MSRSSDPAGERTASQASPRRRVNVVPHTHWDREWYLPFQTFRLRLVDLLDELLPAMEADPSYAHFLLDGQLAVVDDYLAVRPEAAERLRRLVGNGRIAVGPWYTLPDEFLVSGETHVRNLQLGARVADRFGGPMAVGYLPDMFGHVAQMPQILAGFGLRDAVVWRGVPAAVDRSAFWWQALDGTTLRAEYLPQGYGNGARLPDDAKALLAQVRGWIDVHDDLLVGPVLWMNGTDHQVPRPWLGRVVAEANALADDLELRITSLAEHLADAPTDDLPTWRGELRSGARANLLMGVTSNRVDVRAAAARAERALERGAEPLSALHLPAERWPTALLDEAWRAVIRNAAHDSVCACSVDEVCDAVLHRYAEAAAIGEGLAERATTHLASRVGHDGPVVVNPSARDRSGLVRVVLPGDEAPAGTQLLAARAAESVLLDGPPAMVVPAVEELDWVQSITAFTLEAADGTPLVSSQRQRGGLLVTPEVRAALAALDDPGPLRVRVRQDPEVTVLAHVADVPGFGWTGWSPDTDDRGRAPAPVTVVEDAGVDGRPTVVLANGLAEVAVDGTDGTFALDGHRGLGRFVDGGDCGDTYNWCPPAEDTLVDRPDSVEVTVRERGPLRARVAVTARYRWPARCEGLDRRVGEVTHDVQTLLELRAGERAVRVEVRFDNRSRDHRLRWHLPLPHPADRSRAECAFAVVERGLDAEGGPTEVGLPTFPAQRFVQAGGLTVVHDGVTEYELVDVRDGTAHELALMVARCTGMLSQMPMSTRPLPAGPLIPVEGAQLQGPVVRRFAVAVGDDVDPYALGDDVLVPLRVAAGGRAGRTGRTAASATAAAATAERDDTAAPRAAAGAGTAADRPVEPWLPPVGSALRVRGAEVSAVLRDGGTRVVRVFNPTDQPTTVTVEGGRGWLVDLRGRPLEPFEESFDLRPWGIATLALTD